MTERELLCLMAVTIYAGTRQCTYERAVSAAQNLLREIDAREDQRRTPPAKATKEQLPF